MTRILFVCHYNTDLSPLAAGQLALVLTAEGHKTLATPDSAGLLATSFGADGVDETTLSIGQREGIPLANFRKKKFDESFFSSHDLIIATTDKVFNILRQTAPPQFQAKIHYLYAVLPEYQKMDPSAIQSMVPGDLYGQFPLLKRAVWGWYGHLQDYFHQSWWVRFLNLMLWWPFPISMAIIFYWLLNSDFGGMVRLLQLENEPVPGGKTQVIQEGVSGFGKAGFAVFLFGLIFVGFISLFPGMNKLLPQFTFALFTGFGLLVMGTYGNPDHYLYYLLTLVLGAGAILGYQQLTRDPE